MSCEDCVKSLFKKLASIKQCLGQFHYLRQLRGCWNSWDIKIIEYYKNHTFCGVIFWSYFYLFTAKLAAFYLHVTLDNQLQGETTCFISLAFINPSNTQNFSQTVWLWYHKPSHNWIKVTIIPQMSLLHIGWFTTNDYNTMELCQCMFISKALWNEWLHFSTNNDSTLMPTGPIWHNKTITSVNLFHWKVESTWHLLNTNLARSRMYCVTQSCTNNGYTNTSINHSDPPVYL